MKSSSSIRQEEVALQNNSVNTTEKASFLSRNYKLTAHFYPAVPNSPNRSGTAIVICHPCIHQRTIASQLCPSPLAGRLHLPHLRRRLPRRVRERAALPRRPSPASRGHQIRSDLPAQPRRRGLEPDRRAGHLRVRWIRTVRHANRSPHPSSGYLCRCVCGHHGASGIRQSFFKHGYPEVVA